MTVWVPPRAESVVRADEAAVYAELRERSSELRAYERYREERCVARGKKWPYLDTISMVEQDELRGLMRAWYNAIWEAYPDLKARRDKIDGEIGELVEAWLRGDEDC